jgi:hypothetical protein
MTFDIELSITDIQERQQENIKRAAEFKPSGAAGKAIQFMTAAAHRYLVSKTHVWKYRGGGYRASQRMEVQELSGRLFVDPNTVNPRGQKPVEYSVYEEARGGEHAAYAQTRNYIETRLMRRGVDMIRSAM